MARSRQLLMEPVVEFTPEPTDPCRINVLRNGRPYGQMWTFPDTREEWHPWHGKTLAGSYFRSYGTTSSSYTADSKMRGRREVESWFRREASY